MFDHAEHIRALMTIRRSYKDALIYGAQIYQPASNVDAVIAYRYHGRTHDVITIVNIANLPMTADLVLMPQDHNTSWHDLMSLQRSVDL